MDTQMTIRKEIYDACGVAGSQPQNTEDPRRESCHGMPAVSWEYETICQGDEPHLEFRGRTPDDEMILANARPPIGHRYDDWLNDFESERLSEIPVSIDTYFGPDDEPGVAAHTIFIGEGHARLDGPDVRITLSPRVFQDAAASVLESEGSEYAAIELRIFHIFTLIDREGFSRFRAALEGMPLLPPTDPTWTAPPKRTVTIVKRWLSPQQMMSVLRSQDGIISFQQLHAYVSVQERTVRRWLQEADMLDPGHRRLTGCLFTSNEILNGLVLWLRRNITTEKAREFVGALIIAKLIPR